MKLLASDKYNVAWFKLADLVARGEKERALGMYRLLAHSFDNVALALQLEADLLLAFNDETAFEKYEKSAELYAKSGKTIEAIAVYEAMRSLKPDIEHYYQKLIMLYEKNGSLERIPELMHFWCYALIHEKKFLKAANVVEKLQEKSPDLKLADLYCAFVVGWIGQPDASEQIITATLFLALDELIAQENAQIKLQEFLATLRALDEKYYAKASEYIRT